MIYLSAVLIVLFELSFRPVLHLWGGECFLLAGLMVLAAAEGQLELWLIFALCLAITSWFFTLSFLTVVLPVIVISLLAFIVFRSWVHQDSALIKIIITTLLIEIIMFFGGYPVSWQHPLFLLGSTILTLPVIIAWYLWRSSPERRLV